MEKSLRFW